MAPQKAIPTIDIVYSYCREDDGHNSTLKKISEDLPRSRTSSNEFNRTTENDYIHIKSDRGDSGSNNINETENFIVGDRVWVGGSKAGIIAFIGETQFGPGDWAGVVLDEPVGKNDGSIAGIRYFQCAPNKGIFARTSRLSRSPVDFQQLYDTSYAVPASPDCRSISSFSRAGSTTGAPTSRSQKSLGSAPLSGSDVKLGNRVIVQSSQGSKAGVLRYYGSTEFGSGMWCGVELDEPLGKNDGTVAGVRYFECEPKFGLFVPAEKVSRSPITKKNTPACVVHPEGISRQGTLESIRTTSTVQTSASAMKNKRTPVRSSLAPGGTTSPCRSPQPNRTAEKDKYIAQLLRERELERAQVTRAATQAEEVEKKLFSLRGEYDQLTVQHELDKTNSTKTIQALEAEKNALKQQLDEEKRKIEDLIFNYEEESITKSEIQALNEEYVEKLKQIEQKVVSSQHASLEYDVNSRSAETKNASSETSAATSEALSLDNDCAKNEHFDAQTLTVLFDEQKRKLENECRALKDEIEKLQLIDKNKDEVIHNLRKEIDNYKPLCISDDNAAAIKECQYLKDKCSNLEAKNDAAEEQLRVLKLQLNEMQDELSEKSALWQKLETNMKHELEEFRTKHEEMVFRLNELSGTVSEKEELLKSNSQSFIKYLKKFSSYLNERNEVINSALFGNESSSITINALRLKDMTQSFVFDDDSDANANIVSDFGVDSLQLKEEFFKLKEFVDQMINTSVTSLEKLETLTEVINRKDKLLEEIIQEKDALRQEFQDAMESDKSEIELLKNRFEDLNKMKLVIEKQLNKSEENLKKLEASSSQENDAVHKELENVRNELNVKTTSHNQISQELSALKIEIGRVNEEKNKERDEFQRELDRFKNSVEILQQENTKNCVSLAEKLKFEEECGVLRREVEDSKNILAKMREENEQNRQLLLSKAQSEAERDALQHQVDALKVTLETQQKEIEMNSSVRTENKNLENERVILQKEFDNLKIMFEGQKEENEKNAALLAEKAATDAKCVALQEEISHVRSILEASQNENEKISLLILDKKKSDARNEALRSEVDDLKTTVEKLRKENERNALLLTEKEELVAKCDCLQNEVVDFRNVLESSKEENEALLLQKKESDARTDILEKEVENLKTAFETLQKENERNCVVLEEKVKRDVEYESMREEINTTKNALEASLKENEKHSLLMRGMADTEVKNNALELEVANLKRNVEELRIENDKYVSLSAEKMHVVNECAALRQQISEFQTAIERSEKVNEKFSQLSVEKVESDAKCVSLQKEIDNLRISFEALQKQYDHAALMIADRDASKQELEILHEKLKNLNSVLEATQKENTDNASLLGEKAETDAKCVILQQKVDNLQNFVAKLQKESDENLVLLATKANVEGECENLQREISSLKNALDLSLKEVEKASCLLDERTELFNKNGVLLQEVIDLQTELGILRKANEETWLTQNKQSEAECEALKRVVDQLQNNLESVQKENREKTKLLSCRTMTDVEVDVLQKELLNLKTALEASKKENEKNASLLALKIQSDAHSDALQQEMNILKTTVEILRKGSDNDNQTSIPNGENFSSSSMNNSSSLPDELSNEVQFLNTVIVELQRKNERLGEKIRFLEELVPPEKLKPKKIITPRLFCDICDIFDAHDTEDCPVQCSEPVMKSNTVKKKPLPRPYCEICEVFGHETSECNDDETF